MKDINNLGDTHFDILKEIGSIGSGNAVTSLGKMLEKKVEMPVPSVKLLEFKDIAGFIGGPSNIIVGVLVSLTGDINGIMMFILDMKSANAMVDVVMGGMVPKNDTFGELEMSAVNEIGNILISAYVGSLSGLTKLRITPSIPYMSIDMANAILSVPAIEFGKVADRVLFIESGFKVDKIEMSGYFILVPDMPSLSRILSALGVG
ncbi:MAG: chemotaxis protein CheC [Defluviitaleaceae bacterium]|nr:chemotaxis protein CheC [Defluviitaleaceae bacterium]